MNRLLTTFVFWLLLINQTNAQQNQTVNSQRNNPFSSSVIGNGDCGFQPTQAQINAVENDREYQKAIRDFMSNYNSRGSQPTVYVPIKAHIVRTSAGTGGLTTAQLTAAMANMNNYYQNANMQFYLCDGINYIDDDTYYDYDTSEEAAMHAANGVTNLINIYFCNTVYSGASALCGYAYFPGGPDVILMANSCAINGSTLPHEVGHFFTLYHTHGVTNGILTDELVNGNNCTSAGDRVCDTEADPQLGSANVSAACAYNGTAPYTGGVTIDSNGDSFVPNPNNIMSYSRKSCRNFFSAGQYARIYAGFSTQRNYFTCPTFNVDFTDNNTNSCSVPVTINFTDASAGATSWLWDIDGDNIVDYTSQNPSHIYTVAGNYNVCLGISNGTDTIYKTRILSIGAVYNVPYSEDFESFTSAVNASGLDNGWETSPNNTTIAYRWNPDNGGTPSGSTGPLVDNTTATSSGHYMFTEASGYTGGDVCELISPCIDLNVSNPELSFAYHMHGTSMGELHLDIFSGGIWTNDITTAIVGQQHAIQTDTFSIRTVDLTAYSGQTVKIRFRGIRGSSWSSDMAIDDVQIISVGAAPIAGFTSSKSTVCISGTAQMTDQSSNSPSSWLWTVSPGTYNFSGGTSSSSQNPIIEFTAAGNYDIKLVTTNAFGSDSITLNSIVTASTGTVLPLTEDFTAPAFPPAGGWSVQNPDNDSTWRKSVPVTSSDGGSSVAACVNNYNYNASGQEDGITTMILDITGIINPLLTFDLAYAPYDVSRFESLRVDVSTDCGDSFTPTAYLKSNTTLATVPAQTNYFTPTDSSHWRRDSVDLSSYTGTTLMVRIVNINGNGNALYLDNINIKESFCSPLTLTSSVTDVLCNGSGEGSIDLSVSGGSAPYIFSWSNGATDEDPTGLSAGNYSVVVTDNEGCTGSRNDQINEPAQLTATSSKGNVTCNSQDNGTARVVVSGGTSPYTYLWNTNPAQTTDQISNLGGGIYNCVITDDHACSKSLDISIFNPTALIALSIPNNPNPGDINLLVSGGIAPYVYSWSTGATTEDVSGLAPGFYFCQVADRNGCAKIHSITLSNPNTKVQTDNTENISRSVNDGIELSIYPNPSSGNTNLILRSNIDQVLSIELIDIAGKKIGIFEQAVVAGMNQTELHTDGLSTGLYRITVRSDKYFTSETLVIE